jgi:hypothetical protein
MPEPSVRFFAVVLHMSAPKHVTSGYNNLSMSGAPVGSSGHPLLHALCASLALGCVGAMSSWTVRVWECLQSPVGRGSGPACVCPVTSMGCCRVPAGYVLFVPVLFMRNVVVLLLMHLLGAADCVVASYVFVIFRIYREPYYGS